MPRGKKFSAEQIIGKLREAEVGLAQGKTVPEVVRKLGVTEQTHYRWKREYGGLVDSQCWLLCIRSEHRRVQSPHRRIGHGIYRAGI
jgi:putative transposase